MKVGTVRKTGWHFFCQKEQFWMCSFFRENDKTDINHWSATNVFLRFVNDIERTIGADTKELLDAVISLYPNLQFTLETTDEKKSLPFLDMSINVQLEGTIFCTWYQKPSDIGTILNYRSCAPHQHKKTIIQGTMHRLFRATSNWEAFHEALKKINEIWERNQYPRHWIGNIVKDTIDQLRLKEQRKGNKAGGDLIQQKNTEKE